MSWTTRVFSRAGALALCTALMGLFNCTVANAASISYGDFGPLPSGTSFLDITESSGTDSIPLYGPPTIFETGLDFTPVSFVAVSTGGAPDITDGQLTFTVMSSGLSSLSVEEAGDFSLLGIGTAATSVTASASILATVTEINGAAVVPIVLAFNSNSVTHNLAANPGALQPWSLVTTLDIGSQLGAGQRATKVDIAINNQMSAFSEPASAAFIAKKEFIVTTELIPEPATFALASLALFGMAFSGRRR
ncbi:MAG TPA: PEP-CTERM sorting domain-containing protein [Lacipirellula sp.]